jgi:hypothetical protein
MISRRIPKKGEKICFNVTLSTMNLALRHLVINPRLRREKPEPDY